jgi:hypothetical protein
MRFTTAKRNAVATVLSLLPSVAVALADRHVRDGDVSLFVKGGHTLLSASWAHTFGDTHLQAGPLQLLALAAADRLAVPLSVTVEVAVAALLVLSVSGARTRLLVGAAAAALGLTHFAYAYGHPAEATIPIFWLAAAGLARRRPLAAGLLVGASAGFEVWGILGVAVLLLARSPRAALAAGTAASLTAAALFAPFVAMGDFHMFAYHWAVAPGTLVSLVAHAGAPYGWPLRLAQGGAAVAAGALAAWRLRGRAELAWLVPLTVVVVRIAADPVYNPWYFLAVETIGLVAAARFSPRVRALRPRRSSRAAATRTAPSSGTWLLRPRERPRASPASPRR